MTHQLVNQFKQVLTLIRAREWWSFKGAPVLGTAYATTMILNTPLTLIWTFPLFLLIAVVGSYVNLLNDFCDQEEDRISGKTNRMLGRSSLFKVIALVACIVPGLLAAGLLIQMPIALGIYLGIWVVFTAYSVPPVRLKQRGFWGVLADAFGAHVLPQLFAVTFIIYATGKTTPTLWVLFISIWALASGLRGILWHQLIDFENDSTAQVNTFAVASSPITLELLGKWVVFPVEIATFAVLLILANNVLVWAFLVLYLATEWLRHYFWQINIVIVKPRQNNWHDLSDRLVLIEYYDVFYPLAFLGTAVWHSSVSLIILGVHGFLYAGRIWLWLRDIWRLLRWEIPNKIQNNTQEKKVLIKNLPE